AVCDQMEVPGPGKQLVRREIVRLVTPGTLVDEEALEAREPLWLAAVACAEGRAAVALLDASTGELRALPEAGVEEALDELARVRSMSCAWQSSIPRARSGSTPEPCKIWNCSAGPMGAAAERCSRWSTARSPHRVEGCSLAGSRRR